MAVHVTSTTLRGMQTAPLFAFSFNFDPSGQVSSTPVSTNRLSQFRRRTGRNHSGRVTPSTDVYSNGGMITRDRTEPALRNLYYNGVELDSGIIALDKTYALFLSNLFSYDVQVDSIYVTPGQSVSVTDILVGALVPAKGSVPFSILIDEEGSSRINADIIFTFSNGHTTAFSVVAIRTPLGWMFTANWKNGLEYTRRFLTSVESSETGSEFRKMLRPAPIREAVIPLTASGVSDQYFSQVFLKSLAETEQFLPIYSDLSLVTAPCVKNTYRIYCGTSTYRFKVGGLAALVKRCGKGTATFELVEIAAILADGLTARFPLSGDYGANDFIYPMEECVIRPDGQSLKALTNTVSELTITATSKDGTVELENSSYAPSFYSSLPVYPFRTNWIDGVDINIISNAVREDSGRGQNNYLTGGRAFSSWGVSSFFATREEYWIALGFFNYIKGRGRAFFMAHPVDWLPFETALDSHTFKLTDETFGLHIDGFLKYLYISNGTVSEIVTVTNIYTSGTGGAVIETSTPTVVTSGVSSIAQAVPVRIDSDDMTETWLTNGCVEMKFSVRELPEI